VRFRGVLARRNQNHCPIAQSAAHRQMPGPVNPKTREPGCAGCNCQRLRPQWRRVLAMVQLEVPSRREKPSVANQTARARIHQAGSLRVAPTASSPSRMERSRSWHGSGMHLGGALAEFFVLIASLPLRPPIATDAQLWQSTAARAASRRIRRLEGPAWPPWPPIRPGLLWKYLRPHRRVLAKAPWRCGGQPPEA